MTIEELLLGVKEALEANTAALKANAGNAAVNADAVDDTVKKLTHFHIASKNEVVEVKAGGTKPLGGIEVPAAEAKELHKKYAAAAAASTGKKTTAPPPAPAPAPATTTTDGPTFAEVYDKVLELSKKPIDQGGGREVVKGLFKVWGVSTFPEAEGKIDNAKLMADVQAKLNPSTPAADDVSDLGL